MTCPTATQRRLQMIEGAMTRAESTTSQLLAYTSKSMISQPIAIDVEDFIHKLQAITQTLRTELVSIQLSTETTKPILANPDMLMGAIINIVKNAIEALPKGGEIRVLAREVSKKEIQVNNLSDKRSYTAIEVIDNGEGIPEDIRSNVFDPFFSTKPAGKGVGLGLWTVYNFARQSEGAVTYDMPEEGKSRFCLFLPHASSALQKR